MLVWVITHGVYEDETIVGVATSEDEAKGLIKECGPRNGWTDELEFYGPFQVGHIDLNKMTRKV